MIDSNLPPQNGLESIGSTLADAQEAVRSGLVRFEGLISDGIPTGDRSQLGKVSHEDELDAPKGLQGPFPSLSYVDIHPVQKVRPEHTDLVEDQDFDRFPFLGSPRGQHLVKARGRVWYPYPC